MKKSSLFQAAVVVGLVMASHVTHAADDSSLGEIVVTATRNATPIEQIGNTIYVVTAKEIEQKQKRTVAEALESVPGVTVSRSGGIGGQATSVFIRGAESRFTLVLINGIPMNDPSSVGDTYNFDRINIDNIERIEVLEGSQSTLYGSRAIGGVINIITKKSTNKNVVFSSEAGSFNTFKNAGSIAGGNEKIQFLFDISQLNAGGVTVNSAQPDKDAYHLTSFTSNISITPDAVTDINLLAKKMLSNANYDDTYSPNTSPYVKSNETILGLTASRSFFNEQWKSEFIIGQDKITRDYLESSYPSHYEGKIDKYSWLNTYKPIKSNSITLGFEKLFEEATTNSFTPHHDAINSLFAQDQATIFEDVYLTVGGRIDDHNQFGTHGTYKVAAAYTIKEQRITLRSSLGTGFKAPSLAQLYDSSWGSNNPNLKPEKSKSWDVGFDKTLVFLQSKLGVSWFHNTYTDLISSSFATHWQNTNIAHAQSSGLGLNLSVIPSKDLTISTNYTYTKTRDDQGQELLRRPQNQFNVSGDYRLSATVKLGAELTYVGSRQDYINITGPKGEVGGYYLVNMTGSYDINKSLQLFARVNNLFDRSYQNVSGYNNPGIATYAGIKASF